MLKTALHSIMSALLSLMVAWGWTRFFSPKRRPLVFAMIYTLMGVLCLIHAVKFGVFR